MIEVSDTIIIAPLIFKIEKQLSNSPQTDLNFCNLRKFLMIKLGETGY